MPQVELSEKQVQMVIESLGYTKMSKSGGTAPNELKRKDLAEIDELLAHLRLSLRD